MSKSLLHQLAFSIWAMRPEAVEAYLPQVMGVLENRQPEAAAPKKEAELMEQNGLYFLTASGDRIDVTADSVIEPQPGLVAVINLEGPVMKNDFCGAAGTMTMARWLQQFDATAEVEGVVLNGDSPGGNGYGMLALTSQLDRMKKPVVSLVQHGMACSAAYGIVACTDMVLASNDTDEFGSIGTYVQLPNMLKYYREQHKLDVHVVKATRSTAKLRSFQEAMKADVENPEDPHYRELREGYIDPFNEHFINLVQQHRPGVKDEREVFNGRVFFAQEALELGLIDQTNATMETAVAAVRDLAKQRNTTN